MKKTFWADIDKPILALAPMAGYTESPFRQLVKEIEPSVVLISELTSVEGIKHGNDKTRNMISFAPSESPYYGVQLFGNDTQSFIEAAKVVEDMNADFIDLNFGCPSPKIINSGNGSALLRDLEASTKMIEALVQSTKLPVTVKMRLGFYNDEETIKAAQMFESAGIQALAIHGRTTTQKFEGTANWEKIYQVKKALSIPVIGNGDIDSAEKAKEYIKNLDGIMIGRAAIRNPWIFKQCRQIFNNKQVEDLPPIKDQLDLFYRHARLATEMKGERYAMIELRKHFAHIIRGISNAAQFRERLIRIEKLDELKIIFDEILAKN